MGAPTDGTYDVIVIGAGFGGLGAALTASEAGARVLLLEALNYPGGCASTFRRSGYRFEAGATLFSGLGPGQLFRRWIERHGLPVSVDFMSPVVEFRTRDWNLDVQRDRTSFFRALARLPNTPIEALARLERHQRRVANVLWEILEHPEWLPPMRPSALLAHARRLPAYALLVPFLGVSLGRLLDRWGLPRNSGVRTYLDALCQITIQCAADEAEAPFALGTMDYYFRGTGHVRGGIGELATGLCTALQGMGQDVRLAHRVRGIARDGAEWVVRAKRSTFRAPIVIANVLPRDLMTLDQSGASSRAHLDVLQSEVEAGWGAAMLYLAVEPPPGTGPEPRHFELVIDPDRPLIEGNHLFCSVSGARDLGRAPPGQRTMTVSTHVPMQRLLNSPDEGAYIAEVQRSMRRGLERLLPEWWNRRVFELTASPRTFERFTGRTRGFVGGVPRRVGLQHYRGLFPSPVEDGLYLVGDTMFPGQSTLATALGGYRSARSALGAGARLLDVVQRG